MNVTDYSKETIQSLATTAEVLVRGRGYRIKNIEKNDDSVDVVAIPKKSKDKILIRIVTEPILDSGRVGKKLASKMEAQLEKEDFEKGVLIGKSFTSGAKSDLEQEGVEFISKGESVVKLIDPFRLYPRVQDSVDNLCKSACGKIPKSEKQCKGYNPEPKKCPTCKGTGTIKKNGRELTCPDCNGKAVEPKYTCKVRLISDNADFHFERGWFTLLRYDLNQLLKIQATRTSKPKLSEKIMNVL